MILTIRGVDDIVARINEELPPEIRIWGLVRTLPRVAYVSYFDQSIV